MSQTAGWEIRRIARSDRNGRFYIQGVNHETTDPLFREFSWHVQSLTADGRYWIAEGAEITQEARALLARYGAP